MTATHAPSSAKPRMVAVIPARGGSVRIPRKNLVMIAGKPLLAHSIEQALAADGLDGVYVSTDDAEISDLAVRYGATVISRPTEISGGTASSETALLHALDTLDPDQGTISDIMMLQCTSPVRGKNDISKAIQQYRAEAATSLLSVVRTHRFLWRSESGTPKAINYDPIHRPRSQDMAPQYFENGSIYITSSNSLRRTGNRLGGRITLFEMDFWAGFEIDDPDDLSLIDWIMRNQTGGRHAA